MISDYETTITYLQDLHKPVPLQIAENIHKESKYLLNAWDCSDKTNEWVRRMRQQGYEDVNYVCGMAKTENGSYERHAWGEYLQPIELTFPLFIEAKEIGTIYIPQPSRIDIDCEVCQMERHIFSWDTGLQNAYKSLGDRKIIGTIVEYPFMVVFTEAVNEV